MSECIFFAETLQKMQCLQMRLKSDVRLGIVAPAEQYRQRRYGAAAEVRKARPDCSLSEVEGSSQGTAGNVIFSAKQVPAVIDVIF